MPETITTRCPSWARSKHRSLMTRVSGGFRSSGKKSPFTEVAILGYPTVQFKKADSFGFEPRRAAIGEKRPKNRGRMRALCQEMWSQVVSSAKACYSRGGEEMLYPCVPAAGGGAVPGSGRHDDPGRGYPIRRPMGEGEPGR